MDAKHPLSLQNKKLSHRGKPLKRQITLLGRKKKKRWSKIELSEVKGTMHRSHRIWPINGLDPIGISQLALTGRVHWKWPYEKLR